MIEAVDGLKSLLVGEGQPIWAGPDNWAIFRVQILLDDMQITLQIMVVLPISSVRWLSSSRNNLPEICKTREKGAGVDSERVQEDTVDGALNNCYRQDFKHNEHVRGIHC